jgi:single-strand DNA-binding protein
MNINVANLSGRLTRDAEIRFTSGGTPVVNFVLASGRSIKKGDGWEEFPMFFEVTKMGAGVDKLAPQLTKGREITVHGKLRQDRWQTAEGGNRSKVVIWAEVIKLGLEPKGNGNDSTMTDKERYAADEEEMNRREAEGMGEFQDEMPF